MSITPTLYTGHDVAKRLFPGNEFDANNAFAIAHIGAAIENLAEWRILNGQNPSIDIRAIAREVREMNMAWRSKDAIVDALEHQQHSNFACKWVLPTFHFNEAGFVYSK